MIKKLLSTLLISAFIGIITQSQAATYTVSSLANSGPGTLRTAITTANGVAGPHIINFSLTGTVDLTTVLPSLLRDITFNAHASGNTINRLSGTFRLLESTSAITVEINGFTFSNGNGTGEGGALYFTSGSSTLTITNCLFSNNSCGSHGGAVAARGAATVQNCTFLGNSANGHIGALFLTGASTVSNCTFSGNTAGGCGGALYLRSSASSAINCTIINNTCVSANEGGGLYVFDGVEIKNCIIANNLAAAVPNDVYGVSPVSTQTTSIVENSTGTTPTWYSTTDPNLGSATVCGKHTKYIPGAGSDALNNGTAAGAPVNDICGIAYGTMDIGSASSSTVTTATTFPGSGNTLSFDGINDVVENTHGQGFANTGTEFTIECWVKSSDGSGSNNAFITNYGGTGQTPFFMLGFDGTNAFFWCRNSTGNSVKPTSPKSNVVDGTWHHLAGVRASTGTFLYIDGVLVSSGAASTGDLSWGATLSIMDHFNRYTSGNIDEVRIWNDARTLTEIRDNMCQKLSGTESNLELYYRMDQESTTSVTDNSGNGHTGTLLNMDAATDWITSGAPIGDASVHAYTVSTATADLNIAHANGDDATIDITGGTAAAIHLYRVDAQPNVTTPPGIQTLLSQFTYYGVHSANSTGLTYTYIYNYDGHPGIIDEDDMALAKRDNNADNTWSEETATLDKAANTLTLTGQTGTEYILGSNGVSPLPVKLSHFDAKVMDNQFIKLDWQTASEVNNNYFTVERSQNGTEWMEVTKINGAGNSSSLLNYSTIDDNPYVGVSYYRIKQNDFDGKTSYSQVRSVNIVGSVTSVDKGVVIYPNPTTGNIKLTFNANDELSSKVNIQIVDFAGKIVKKVNLAYGHHIYQIDLSGLAKGVYMLQLESNGKTESHKLTKK